MTVHDLQHELYPQFFSRAELAYRRVLYRQPVTLEPDRRSPSPSTPARRCSTRYGLDPTRVVAIPLGVDHDRLTPGDGPREPFLLYPANPWPHKNHARLYEAFALVRRERPELRLVLTGTGHAATLPDGVESRGRVSYDELSASTAPRRRSSSRACTRASACRRSRRWPAAARSPRRARRRCPRSAATRPSCFDPMSPEDMARAIEAVLADPAPYVERGLARGRGCSAGRRPHGRTRTSTGASPRGNEPVRRARERRQAPRAARRARRGARSTRTARRASRCRARRSSSRPPFPLRHAGEYDVVRVGPLLEEIAEDHLAGAVLVRLGGYAVGVFEGERLVASKVGQRLVHGRHRAGGSSANRFRRRREEQARVAARRRGGRRGARARAVPRAGSRRSPSAATATAVRRMVELRPELEWLDDLALARFFTVPDPRRAVLDRFPYDLYAVELA